MESARLTRFPTQNDYEIERQSIEKTPDEISHDLSPMNKNLLDSILPAQIETQDEIKLKMPIR